ETANNSFTDYSALVTELSDRNSVLTTEVQDEELRRGVQLIDMSDREIDLTSRLVRFSLLSATTGDHRVQGPGELSTAAEQADATLKLHSDVLDLATGPYADAAANMKAETDATGLLGMGPKLLKTGTVDVPGMLKAISLKKDQSYYGFLRDVSAIVQHRADQLNAQAATRSRWYLIGAVVVMLAAIGAIL